MSAAKHTPGPWAIEPRTEGRGCLAWSVVRFNPSANPGYAFESLLDDRGCEAIFYSTEEARSAIAKATGVQS